MQKACFVIDISADSASLRQMFWSVNIVCGAFPFIKPKKAFQEDE
jgi:hypothetical protein